jgi:hypothetical protein
VPHESHVGSSHSRSQPDSSSSPRLATWYRGPSLARCTGATCTSLPDFGTTGYSLAHEPPVLESMRSLESAVNSWREFKSYRTLEELKRAVRLEGHSSPVASANLRSACWKAFLLFENLDPAEWPRTLAAHRSAYDSLRTHFLNRPQEDDSSRDVLRDQNEVCRTDVTCRLFSMADFSPVGNIGGSER